MVEKESNNVAVVPFYCGGKWPLLKCIAVIYCRRIRRYESAEGMQISAGSR